MAIDGIDTVAVVVSDRHKSLAWYRDVLGLKVAYVAPGGGHWMELGAPRPHTRLHLCELPEEVEPGPTGVTLLTSDIHAEYERLRAKGVVFRSPPKQESWGEWLCAFVDPDGNEFDLKQPLDPALWKQ